MTTDARSAAECSIDITDINFNLAATLNNTTLRFPSTQDAVDPICDGAEVVYSNLECFEPRTEGIQNVL